MSSLWARAFSCCVRARSHQVGPHERTPLIPDVEQAPTPSQTRSIDHQKLKERLGSIVRSKEGKMVNVNAQIPFNLYNQKFGPHLSSSRSVRSPSGGARTSYSNQNSRRPSPSPSPSLQLSLSTASLPHPGDAASSSLSIDTEQRRPILNVRLVRGSGRNRSSSSRARGRLGRYGEEGGREIHVGNEDSSSQREYPIQVYGPDSPNVDDADSLKTPRPADQVPQWTALRDASVDASADVPQPRPRVPDFKIQNAGVISRSWGD